MNASRSNRRNRRDGHDGHASDRTAERPGTSDEAANAAMSDRQPPPVEEPVPEGILAVAGAGLEPRPQPAKRVIVIGAGLSGLVAAFELRRQGHEPLILEAQQRVGGRVYTLRAPFAPGLYAEAGGMRIPRAHDLTLAYCELFGLELRPFVMGNPQGPRVHRRRANDGGRGGERTRNACRSTSRHTSRAGPSTRSGTRRRATSARWSSARARRPGSRSSRSTTRIRCASS